MNSKDWKKWLFWFTFAVASIVVYKTIDSVGTIFTAIGGFFGVLMPFLMAILLAYILYIPCKRFEKLFTKVKFLNKHARGLSVLSIYLITALIIFVIFNFVLPSITTSITDLTNNLPGYFNRTIEYFNNLDEDSFLASLKLNEYVNKLKEINIATAILDWINLENITNSIKGLVGSIGIIFDAFITIVVSVYMLLERNDIKSFCVNLSKAIFDKKTNEAIARYYRETNSIFFSYIAGQLLDAFVVGIITSIAMALMHIKYAALLGFMIGLFNVIPYFGAIVAVIIASIITIFTGGLAQALWMTLVIIILQQIDANIINPKILGNSLNLSPILIIFAVTVGGTYFGVLGMFLSVPLIAFLKLILKDFITYQNNKKKEIK